MDPNETLRLIRLTIGQMKAERKGGPEWVAHAQEVTECWASLDEWLTKGGFYPRGWAKAEADAGRIG